MKTLFAALLLAASVPARPAAAKVVFTGYGSFSFVPDANLRIYGPPLLLGGAPSVSARVRSFGTDAVGLFASSKVGEDSDFLVDLTYKNIGNTVKETRIQYAYLDAGLPYDSRLQAGKVTLPFGYYNTRRFYPFQRPELTAPLFQSQILGLPIADVGGVLSRRFDAGPLALDVRFYAVNGYGSVPGSTAAFRAPSLPGGISVTSNLGTSNNNKDIALGGQTALILGGDGELGLSYYRGAWDASGERVLQLAGAHIHLNRAGCDFLAEYLNIDVTGDEGLWSSFGSRDWVTDGGFVSLSRPLGAVAGRAVTGYGRAELYDGGAKDGTGGHELLRSAAAGFAVKWNEWVTWKGEYLWVEYRLPFVRSPSLELFGYVAQSGLVVTF